MWFINQVAVTVSRPVCGCENKKRDGWSFVFFHNFNPPVVHETAVDVNMNLNMSDVSSVFSVSIVL